MSDFLDIPPQKTFEEAGLDQFGQSPLGFTGNEENRRSKILGESGLPGNYLESSDISPKLNVVDGQFSAGQDSFNSGTGFFLGIDDEQVKFSIGNGSTDYITWDGLHINIRSSVSGYSRTAFTHHIAGASERLSTDITDNTTAHFGLAYLPHGILVNRITLRSGAAAVTPGTIKIAIYSEDGQTKYLEETSATISTTYTYQTITMVTPVYLAPGVYYTAIVGQSTVSASFTGWKSPLDDDTYAVTGGKVTSGYMTVTANTLPATFNPVTDLTFAHNRTAVLRFDNL